MRFDMKYDDTVALFYSFVGSYKVHSTVPKTKKMNADKTNGGIGLDVPF